MICFHFDLIVLGKVFSSCKLFVSGSVLDDLGDRTRANSPERSCCNPHTHTHTASFGSCCVEYCTFIHSRFDISVTDKSEGAEVIPSSNGKLLDLGQNESICLVKGSQINFCQDSFIKWVPQQIKPDDKNKGILTF